LSFTVEKNGVIFTISTPICYCAKFETYVLRKLNYSKVIYGNSIVFRTVSLTTNANGLFCILLSNKSTTNQSIVKFEQQPNSLRDAKLIF